MRTLQHFTRRQQTSPYDDLEFKTCFPCVEISTLFGLQSWKWEEQRPILMPPCGENTVIIQGLHIKLHEFNIVTLGLGY